MPSTRRFGATLAQRRPRRRRVPGLRLQRQRGAGLHRSRRLAEHSQLTSTIHELLVTARHVYESAHVEFDTKVGNPSRLGPAWGTMKRKSAESPERLGAALCSVRADVERLPQAKLEALLALARPLDGGAASGRRQDPTPRADAIARQEEPHGLAAACSGTSPVPSPASVPSPGAGGPSSPFTICNDVPGASVASWLGLLDDDSTMTCPGCGTVGSAEDTSVVLLEHGLKCSHNRCDQKGRDGFRTNVDLVMEVRGVSPIEACRLTDSEFRSESAGTERDGERERHDECRPR